MIEFWLMDDGILIRIFAEFASYERSSKNDCIYVKFSYVQATTRFKKS